MDGEGVFTWNDGRIYQGSFYQDKKHGHGVLTWPQGKVYDGMWINGKQHGEGKYKTSKS